MKAITIWQPWASLIAEGFKPYEFRGWKAPDALIGQRIAIHAGARPVRRGEVLDLLARVRASGAGAVGLRGEAAAFLDRIQSFPKSLWLSSIVCTAVLGKPVSAREILGELGVVTNDSDRDEHFNWAWPLTEVEAVSPPRPARGALGFWDCGDA